MIERLVPSRALGHLLLTGLRRGIAGQLIDHNGCSLSDDEIILHLGRLGFETKYPARDVALIRELARVQADIGLFHWAQLSLEGSIDDTCPSPLRFGRTLEPLNTSQKLIKLEWYRGYLDEIAGYLDWPGPGYADTLQLSQIYRKHWRKFLKTKQK